MKKMTLLFMLLFVVVNAVLAGDLNPPAGPTDASSQMYTTNDLYNRLKDGTSGTKKSTFTGPTAEPANSFKTLNEVMTVAPAQDDAKGADAGSVLSGKTFWGLKRESWGLQTGTMADNGAKIMTPTSSDQTIATGYHNGSGKVKGDTNLKSSNIKAGATIFGVTGHAAIVNTGNGTATAADMLTGKTAYVNGAKVTGSISNNGQGTMITPGTSNKSVAAGFWETANTVAGDADLEKSKIKSGIEIFGVTGTVVEATGDASAANVLVGKTFSKAGSAGIRGTMPDNGAVSITPGTYSQAIAVGYHNGSGTVKGDANLKSSNIKAGATIFGVTGNAAIVNTGDGTATAADMLIGKTAYVNGAKVTGTVAVGADINGTSGQLTIGIPNGLYSGNKTATASDSNLSAGNIKTGITIFGTSGTYTSDATATAADMLTAKTAYVNGAKVTGAIANNGNGTTITPGASNKTIAAGFWNSANTVAGDADLVSNNIKSGVTIFGVAGNSNVVNTSSGDAAASNILINKKAWVDGQEITGTASPAPVAKTGQATSYATGDDGDFKRGVTVSGARFTDNSDGTVTDNLTGLIWLKNANPDGTKTWVDALNYCNNLTAGGYSDWRLPNIKELQSLIDFRYTGPALCNSAGDAKWSDNNPFTGVQPGYYWSSTSYAENTSIAWRVPLYNGNMEGSEKTTASNVWPVRGGN